MRKGFIRFVTLSFLLLGFALPAHASMRCADVHRALFDVLADNAIRKITVGDYFQHFEPINFKSKEKFFEQAFVAHIKDPAQVQMAAFTYDRFNDPAAFGGFLKELLVKASNDSEKRPTREQILDQVRDILTEQGFTFIEINKYISSSEFKSYVTHGVIVVETGFQPTRDGHGLDTHLVQLAYLAKPFTEKYGPGSLLQFYKDMGAPDSFTWGNLFDSPKLDHLGGPEILSPAIKEIGLQ